MKPTLHTHQTKLTAMMSLGKWDPPTSIRWGPPPLNPLFHCQQDDDSHMTCTCTTTQTFSPSISLAIHSFYLFPFFISNPTHAENNPTLISLRSTCYSHVTPHNHHLVLPCPKFSFCLLSPKLCEKEGIRCWAFLNFKQCILNFVGFQRFFVLWLLRCPA